LFGDCSDTFLQTSAMVTFTVLSPAECAPKALADFESLVREGQTVDPGRTNAAY